MSFIDVNGNRLLKEVLDQAIHFSTRVVDGKIAKDEVDILLSLSGYGHSITDSGFNTLRYIRKHHNFMPDAAIHLDACLEQQNISKTA